MLFRKLIYPNYGNGDEFLSPLPNLVFVLEDHIFFLSNRCNFKLVYLCATCKVQNIVFNF
jgi:hypothetical protein